MQDVIARRHLSARVDTSGPPIGLWALLKYNAPFDRKGSSQPHPSPFESCLQAYALITSSALWISAKACCRLRISSRIRLPPYCCSPSLRKSPGCCSTRCSCLTKCSKCLSASRTAWSQRWWTAYCLWTAAIWSPNSTRTFCPAVPDWFQPVVSKCLCFLTTCFVTTLSTMRSCPRFTSGCAARSLAHLSSLAKQWWLVFER